MENLVNQGSQVNAVNQVEKYQLSQHPRVDAEFAHPVLLEFLVSVDLLDLRVNLETLATKVPLVILDDLEVMVIQEVTVNLVGMVTVVALVNLVDLGLVEFEDHPVYPDDLDNQETKVYLVMVVTPVMMVVLVAVETLVLQDNPEALVHLDSPDNLVSLADPEATLSIALAHHEPHSNKLSNIASDDNYIIILASNLLYCITRIA